MSDSTLTHRIGAAVLAAGASTRLGYPKQLIEHEGNSFVKRAALAALEAGAVPVVVVVGASADEVCAALEGVGGVRTVHNARWESGLASSLSVGLAALRADPKCEAALVMVADQPLIESATLQRLLHAFDDNNRIVASSYDDVVGVPVVFGVEHFADLMSLKGDEGAGRWLRSRLSRVTQIPVADAALDIDTPADAAKLAAPDRADDK